MSDAVGSTREAGNALLRLGCLEKNTFCLSLSQTVKVLINPQSNSEENTPGSPRCFFCLQWQNWELRELTELGPGSQRAEF